jgi:hypothetical protein
MNRNSVEEYARGLGLIQYAIDGLTAAELASRPGPGDWSIAQVVIHLMDSDLVGADRMKRVIAEENPTLLAYDENKWAKHLFYEEQSLETAVTIFDLNRRQMAAILRRLDDAAFARSGRHTERGVETLAQLVNDYAEHLDHHLRFVYEKRQRLGRAIAARTSKG